MQERLQKLIREKHHGELLVGAAEVVGTLEGVSLSTKISSVAFSGLGTGIGRVGFHTCAHQVRAAIEHIVLENNDFPATWADASIRHQKLYTEYTRNLQHPE